MKKMPINLIIIYMCFMFPMVLYAGVIDGTITESEYPNTRVFDDGRYTLSWAVKDDIIYIALSAETTGWVAIGIDPDTVMENADMIYGWVDESGIPHIVDAFSTGPYGPHPSDEELGSRNDILDFAGTEQNGRTTIEFSRKTDTGDQYDKTVNTEAGNKIIWSIGASDDIFQRHTDAGYGWLGIGEGQVAKKGSGLLLVTHNVTLSISFIMMVFAMFVARYMKKKRWWLKLHKNLMIYGVGLGIIGIIAAERLLFSASVGHFRIVHSYFGAAAVFALICTPVVGQLILKGKRENKPFYRTLHRWLGRSALILTFVSIILGLFRIKIL